MLQGIHHTAGALQIGDSLQKRTTLRAYFEVHDVNAAIATCAADAAADAAYVATAAIAAATTPDATATTPGAAPISVDTVPAAIATAAAATAAEVPPGPSCPLRPPRAPARRTVPQKTHKKITFTHPTAATPSILSTNLLLP